MAVKLAINGFGRIGRYLVRAAVNRDDVDIVAINTRGDAKSIAHLLKYDSVHRSFPGEIKQKGEAIVVNGKEIKTTKVTGNLTELPWKELGVDIVMETTGKFRDRESTSQHLAAGAKKVIIGAPGKGVDATLVYGVNESSYDPFKHHVVSNASCTTNCLAPVAKVLHENFGIVKGLMTTIHSYTMDQRLLDGSHKDLRRARAAALSMIPTTTGAAVAVAQVIPELKGKLDGLAIRVPTPNVSLVDLVADLSRDITKEEVNGALKKASEEDLKGILLYCNEELVSVDFTSSAFSSIVDAPSTSVIGGNMVKVLAWYDNESGFSTRMVDLAAYMGEKLD
ncbi:MAG: type I glyceraldehyde-3-phosphate dehydrogenase [Deltaproteobacteria bacterium CG12_big_fil_rev_8_21_14_0_65_43_10]|nr:MAG: type I glyceraldehyde-3-phosphate dehydrogenase [Deltaproteobacteria bacterium CG2_30_43_15]PIQ46811.1 MAG: type I glyceraldehyde-3-phosphate dehydrogenase [Deltaproteobacteria bacterium CG12_big_fil_rev_8_21_14_0_65_43_10]PIU84734.1 MAG: type I glyceraldehyde-3-phosphate dehydrogenase [Deltaproteobacteria bacterium CG06_land_8_20_14_3_00_44_19]PIX25560.1 MAG: type I glyceraldehyde-3-phosphate dehydrogenase [Deltaproteobacteria bacterium CG_4_8_14_3_um_filter_43_13]PIZ18532.1 MAG: type 